TRRRHEPAMPRRLPLSLLLLLALALPATLFAADDWNQFRGPGGDGKSNAKNVPVRFGEGKNIAWKTKIHGKGWSSPVVWGKQIWMQTATKDGHEMFAVCVDAETGRIVHDIKVFHVKKPRFCIEANSYASPTPFVEKGRVYVHFGSYGTACLDAKTGKTIWERRDLKCNHFRGPASSPIVHGDRLYVHFDGSDFQYVVALDKTTGKTVWKTDRNIDYGTDNGDRKKAYATPAIITVNGKEQLIAPSAVETIAYDVETGKELWKVRHGGMNAAARPVFGHGLVYISAGSGRRQLIAVKPTGQGDVSDTHIVWQTGRGAPKRSSQILRGDLFFMINDKGVATCLDARTGKRHWTKRIGGDYWASPVLVGNRIYCFSKKGRIPVFKASKTFEKLADNQLGDGFNASPAFVDDAMILRSFSHLYRVERK
ncbi:MAG: PQQ-binding-like beta-propeller repeat protein, partial [Planctomycetaceae bacterium]